MAVYFLTGTLGAGKTLGAVLRIKDSLNRGNVLATNLDLDLEYLLPKTSKQSYIRIPDKPTIEDLEAIGRGSDDVDEKTYGLLVLDELGTWLNSRSWNDKSRQPVLDWFLHARKLGWHIIFIVQKIDLIDKQARDALCEYLVVCRCLDKMPLLQNFLPKYHVATVYYGDSERGFKSDRWWYKGKELYPAYDTRQVFSATYPHGTYSSLSNWHLKTRYETNASDRPSIAGVIKKNLLGYVAGVATASAIAAAAGSYGTPQSETYQPTQSAVSGQPLATISETSSVEKINLLGEMKIVGHIGTRYIISTGMGQQTSGDLFGMGYSVMYLRPCLGRVGNGNAYVDVTCSASLPSPQGAVARSSGISSHVLDTD